MRALPNHHYSSPVVSSLLTWMLKFGYHKSRSQIGSVLIGFMLVAVGLIWIGTSNLHAQVQFNQTSAMDESDTRSITKANFLFHFSASNQWPSSKMEGPFRLAIVGNPSLHAILADKYGMKVIGSQQLEIIAFDDALALERAPFSHVIYCEESGETLERIAKYIEGQPVLLISDASDGLEHGALINFVAVKNRIRYEINSEEASKRNLLIGNRILSWAVKLVP